MCDDTFELEKGREKGVERRQQLNTPILFLFFFFLVCEKSLTLWFFHSFLLILVLAPQFYPRCIASKERKTERESESWLKRHVWWMSIKIKTKQSKHWESLIIQSRCFVMFACSRFSIWTKWKRSYFLVKLDPLSVTATKVTLQHTQKSWPIVLESHTVTSEGALALSFRLHLSGSPEQR